MHAAQFPGAPHHTRMYLLIGTLMIAGILFLLFMNEKEQGFSLTSAVINRLENSSAEERSSDQDLKEIQASKKAIAVQLSFDRIPTVDKKAAAESFTIRFAALTNRITVNDDVLEVNTAGEVTLVLESFSGQLRFDPVDASLEGTASKIEVNGIAFSSKDGLSISFPAMGYESLDLRGLELDGLEFPAGNGELSVGEKLTYQLDGDKVSFYTFAGDLGIRLDNETTVSAEGLVKGVRAGGELDLRLQ